MCVCVHACACAQESQDVINGKEYGSDRKPWKVRVRWRLCNCWQVCVNTFGICSPNAAQRCDSRSVLCFIISIFPCIIIEIVTFLLAWRMGTCLFQPVTLFFHFAAPFVHSSPLFSLLFRVIERQSTSPQLVDRICFKCACSCLCQISHF